MFKAIINGQVSFLKVKQTKDSKNYLSFQVSDYDSKTKTYRNFNVMAFSTDLVSNSLVKDKDKVLVIGRANLDSWTNKDGKSVNGISVIADSIDVADVEVVVSDNDNGR